MLVWIAGDKGLGESHLTLDVSVLARWPNELSLQCQMALCCFVERKCKGMHQGNVRVITSSLLKAARGDDEEGGPPQDSNGVEEEQADLLGESMPVGSPTISLLWPPGVDPLAAENSGLWGEHSAQDLCVEEVVRMLCPDGRYVSMLKSILLTLCPNPHVIGYRQDVLEDCIANPGLRTGLEELLPLLSEIKWLGETYSRGESALFQTIQRMRELDLYVQCVNKLNALLTEIGPNLRSEAFGYLRARFTELEADLVFQSLIEKLPELRKSTANMQSATIAINLDATLRPTHVALLSIDDKPVGPTLLGALLGFKDEKRDYMTIQEVPWMGKLFRDLERILKTAYKPVTKALAYYARLSSKLLVSLAPEVAFCLSAVRMVERMQAAGLPMFRPEVAPAEERVFQVADLYNVRLALARNPEGVCSTVEIVTNDVQFDDDAGRVLILTGPNQGGKTTYSQGVGLVQVLLQAGMYVPGREGRISPVDGIFTHFPLEEKPDLNVGRLGEEAKRLCSIFRQVTRYSLVLLNESLSSTSPGESLYLAQDIVRGLCLYGVRAIFATHLHELAEKIDLINADMPADSQAASIVAGALGVPDAGSEDVVRLTYKIVPAPPIGTSYAKNIANRFGISFEQLAQMLQDRDAAPASEGGGEPESSEQ